MSLLTNIMEHSLDDGYAEAAARRGQVGTSRLPKALGGKLGLAAGLVLAALVVTLGAAQARVSAPTVAKERQNLIDRIQTETKSADALQKNVDSLRDTVSAEQQAALKQPGGDGDRLVELLAAATPVRGPGSSWSSMTPRKPLKGALAARGRAVASPTPGGSATATCSKW